MYITDKSQIDFMSSIFGSITNIEHINIPVGRIFYIFSFTNMQVRDCLKIDDESPKIVMKYELYINNYIILLS